MRMTDKPEPDDDALEALFEKARRSAPEVPQPLMSAILDDAAALQPRQGSGPARWFASIGGLPALGGLIAASCVGFWFGVAPPQGVPDLADRMRGIDASFSEDIEGTAVTGFGWDIEEG